MSFKIHYLFAFALLVAIGSCNKDEDEPTPTCSAAWSTEVQDELDAITAAATAYVNEQSPANCNAYKAAYQEYIDALQPFVNCSALTGQNRTDFQNALTSAQESIDTLC